MTVWLDNHLPLARSWWMRATLGVDCMSVRDLTLQRAADLEIFHAARAAGALVMTKDADFAELVYGSVTLASANLKLHAFRLL